MKSNSARDFIAQAVIAVAVCVGGWMILVKPKVEELSKLEQIMAENDALNASGFNQQTLEKAAQRMTEVKEHLARVRSFNELAGDSSRLYGLVMNLADAHGVEVQSLQPAAVKQVSTDQTVSTTRLNMSVEGGYQNVATFLDAVCSLDAFIRPVSMNITPARQTQHNEVEAGFNCDVLSFALADTLKGVGEDSNAKP